MVEYQMYARHCAGCFTYFFLPLILMTTLRDQNLQMRKPRLKEIKFPQTADKPGMRTSETLLVSKVLEPSTTITPASGTFWV